jgi:hypothetical protein
MGFMEGQLCTGGSCPGGSDFQSCTSTLEHTCTDGIDTSQLLDGCNGSCPLQGLADSRALLSIAHRAGIRCPFCRTTTTKTSCATTTASTTGFEPERPPAERNVPTYLERTRARSVYA